MHPPNNDQVLKLRARIAFLQGTLDDLKNELDDAEADSNQIASAQAECNGNSPTQPSLYSPAHQDNYHDKTFETVIDQLHLNQEEWKHCRELTPEEYKRYGRQLILPEIGLKGAPSSREYNLRLSLIQIGARAATAEECLGPDRRCWRSRMPSCHIPRRCWGGKDWPHRW